MNNDDEGSGVTWCYYYECIYMLEFNYHVREEQHECETYTPTYTTSTIIIIFLASWLSDMI